LLPQFRRHYVPFKYFGSIHLVQLSMFGPLHSSHYVEQSSQTLIKSTKSSFLNVFVGQLSTHYPTLVR